jgi:hypothetical protein
MISLKCAAVVAIAVAASACGQASGDSLRAAPAGGSDTRLPQAGEVPPGPPSINWDRPVQDGIDTTLDRAKADGQLPFDVSAPRFGRAAATVQVTRPDHPEATGRFLALVFKFPESPDYPTDGRVLLQESVQAPMTAADLDVMAQDTYPGMTYTRFTASGGEGILLSANGIGRVILLRRGIKYDLTGPALTPQQARQLAQQL